MSATTSPIVLLCYFTMLVSAVVYWHQRAGQDCWFVSLFCIMPSGAMRASPQGGAIQVSSSAGWLSSLFLKCVLSSAIGTFLPSRGRGHAYVITIAYNILGVPWMALTNSLKEGFSCLLLVFLLNCLWPWKKALLVHMGKIHLNSICLCIRSFTCTIGILGR